MMRVNWSLALILCRLLEEFKVHKHLPMFQESYTNIGT